MEDPPFHWVTASPAAQTALTGASLRGMRMALSGRVLRAAAPQQNAAQWGAPHILAVEQHTTQRVPPPPAARTLCALHTHTTPRAAPDDHQHAHPPAVSCSLASHCHHHPSVSAHAHPATKRASVTRWPSLTAPLLHHMGALLAPQDHHQVLEMVTHVRKLPNTPQNACLPQL
jgi:hypothetical protein